MKAILAFCESAIGVKMILPRVWQQGIFNMNEL